MALSQHLPTCKIDAQVSDLLFQDMDADRCEGGVRRYLTLQCGARVGWSGMSDLCCPWCCFFVRDGLLSWEEFLAGFTIVDTRDAGVCV